MVCPFDSILHMCHPLLLCFFCCVHQVCCSLVFLMSCESTIPFIVCLFSGPGPSYRISVASICIIYLCPFSCPLASFANRFSLGYDFVWNARCAIFWQPIFSWCSVCLSLMRHLLHCHWIHTFFCCWALLLLASCAMIFCDMLLLTVSRSVAVSSSIDCGLT
jgi:hypothetical protein